MGLTVFDRLASSLTDEERRALLDAIIGSVDFVDTPLIRRTEPDASSLDLKTIRNGLSLFQRIRLFFYSLLNKKNRETSLKDFLLRGMRKRVMAANPGYVNFAGGRYLVPFCNDFTEFARAITFFKGPLNASLGDRRREFFAIIAGSERPDIHLALMNAVDPVKAASENPDVTGGELRKLIMENVERLLRLIKKETGDVLLAHARILSHLERLCSFDFDKCLTYIAKDGTCVEQLLTKQLVKLNDILVSFKEAPSKNLLKTTLLFAYQCDNLDDAEIERSLGVDMRRAADVLTTIRRFNDFPLTATIKAFSNDYGYEPVEATGGEEWFILLKRFWTTRADRAYKNYLADGQLTAMTTAIAESYGAIPTMEVVPASMRNQIKPHAVQNLLSLNFISAFLETPRVFWPGKSVIKHIIEEGQWYKRDNKLEFLQTIETLEDLKSRLEAFKQDIGADGLITARFLYHGEGEEADWNTALALVNRAIASMIATGIESLRSLSFLLEGVYKGPVAGGKYDSLSNLPELNRMDSGLMESIKHAYDNAKDLWVYLTGLKDLEDRIYRLRDNDSALTPGEAQEIGAE